MTDTEAVWTLERTASVERARATRVSTRGTPSPLVRRFTRVGLGGSPVRRTTRVEVHECRLWRTDRGSCQGLVVGDTGYEGFYAGARKSGTEETSAVSLPRRVHEVLSRQLSVTVCPVVRI